MPDLETRPTTMPCCITTVTTVIARVAMRQPGYVTILITTITDRKRLLLPRASSRVTVDVARKLGSNLSLRRRRRALQ